MSRATFIRGSGRRRGRLAWVTLALAAFSALPAPARGDAHARGAGTAIRGQMSREFVVQGSGGSFEVPVSPTFVTVFYVPENVTRALASDKENFTIYASGDTVTVRPVRAARHTNGLRANLNIDTESLHLSIILRVVENDEEAVSQVFFVRAEEKAEFERRVHAEVERRLESLRREYDQRQKRLEADVTRRVGAELLTRALDRFEVFALDGIARTPDHVVFRLKRGAYVGDDVLLFFSVENRGDRAYTLRAVDVLQGDRTIPARRVEFRPPGSPSGGSLGRVEAGELGRGVFAIPASSFTPGRTFSVRFTDGRGKSLTITRLRAE